MSNSRITNAAYKWLMARPKYAEEFVQSLLFTPTVKRRKRRKKRAVPTPAPDK